MDRKYVRTDGKANIKNVASLRHGGAEVRLSMERKGGKVPETLSVEGHFKSFQVVPLPSPGAIKAVPKKNAL